MSRAVLLLSTFLLAGCGEEPVARPETAALDRVLPIALAAFDGATKTDGPYRLIDAQQMAIRGRWIWRVTFKAERHLPADPEQGPLTAGGEIFVNVDPATGDATVGYGE
jgi:hypothetical protein